MFSLTPDYEQVSFIEQIHNINELPSRNPIKFLQLLEAHIDLAVLIPNSFQMAYYASLTNHRTYSLQSLLAVLLLMQYFKFDTVSNFVTLLLFAAPVRKFCRITDDQVPDESVLSKFKIRFEKEIHAFFNNLSCKVMDIFTGYNDSLPDNSPQKGLSETLIDDTTGLKPKVKENNPKTLQSQIDKQAKVKKFLESNGEGKNFSIHAAAFKNMPKTAKANSAIRLDFANGHFGYFYKHARLTNGFGIPLHIHFFDEDFYKNLPNDFESPEEQKYSYDNASLYPVLSSFYKRVGNNRFTTFLGDSEFDSYDNYGFLNELGFKKVLIPLNKRNSKPSKQPIPRNADDTPCCPNNPDLTFIPDGSCKGVNRSLRYKFVCPLSRKENARWTSDCKDKCRHTNSTITTYTYPSENLRVYFGVHRGSKEWAKTYKIRTIIEREISSAKSHPALERPNTYNCASIRADVCLNAAAKLITVMLAFAIGKPNYMRNLKNLIKAA